MALLSLTGVSKRYTRGLRTLVALDDVSLDVDAGDFVAIWGSSRSGKTTLLRIAAGIERPDAGAVTFDGRDLATLSRRHRARLLREEIGCVWQTARLTSGLSALDHVALPLLRRHGHAEARRRAHDLLERLGALPCAHARWRELTDGDRMRVALAHALIRQPRLVLADEPTANLNMIERDQVLALLRGLADDLGAAVVMTAPDAPTMLHSHRLLGLDAGRLIAPRPPERGTVLRFPDGGRRPGRGR